MTTAAQRPARIRALLATDNHKPQEGTMPDQPNDLTRKVFRAEIAAVNTHLAETGPSAPADADLRYQVLHALDFAYCNCIGYETPEQLLDAYDAHRPVLPAPADRAAIYRSLADHYDRIAGAAFPGDKTDWYEAIADVAAGLRRMADEAQQAEPALHLGNKANAEDCPACAIERRNLPYPFLCPAAPADEAQQAGEGR